METGTMLCLQLETRSGDLTGLPDRTWTEGGPGKKSPSLPSTFSKHSFAANKSEMFLVFIHSLRASPHHPVMVAGASGPSPRISPSCKLPDEWGPGVLWIPSVPKLQTLSQLLAHT